MTGAFAAFRVDRPSLEAAMHRADDLVREANALADTIRRARAEPHTKQVKGRDLSSLQAQLNAVWAKIRAARVEVPPPREADGSPDMRQTYSKWR
jgi:hypothetical protein